MYQDRLKRNSAALAIFYWPVLKLSTALHLRMLANRDPALSKETSEVARMANSWEVLTSRSLVFTATRL